MKALPMKSYQFFKVYKHFGKEREKTAIQKSKRKEKLSKVGLCFITGCFIEPFKMIINHFFILQAIHSKIFAFYYQDDAINIKRGN